MARYYTLLPTKRRYGRSLFQISSQTEAFKYYDLIIKASNLKVVTQVMTRFTKEDPILAGPSYCHEKLIVRDKKSNFLFQYGIECVGQAKKDWLQKDGFLYLVIVPQNSPDMEIYVSAVGGHWLCLSQKIIKT